MNTASSGMDAWKDKVALVTGGSSGIGEAVAAALADAGMRVAVAARRKDRLDALCARLGGDPQRIMPVVIDLREPASIEAGFAAVQRAWSGVDVLVNNAGLGHRASLIDGDAEQWREMLEVNVLGLCICTSLAVRQMRDRGDDGHVIHISSMSGHRVPAGSGVYSATKYAVRSLTEGLRQELRSIGSKIRVSAVSPGFVETEFAEKYHRSAETAKQVYSRFPVLQPSDIAEAVVYLLACPAHVQVHDILMRPTEQTG